MRTAKRILCLLLCLCMCAPLMAAQAEGGSANAGFTAGAPDSGGIFTVTMTISNATFNAFQFAVRFDPTVIQPVNSSGKEAKSFSECAIKEAEWLSTVGCSVDAATGFLGFTGYVAPGEQANCISDGEAAIGSTAIKMFSFSFKQLKAGDPAIKIATKEQGEPYEHALPSGAGIMGKAGKATIDASFDMTALGSGAAVTKETITPPEPSSEPTAPVTTTEMTADELLAKCLILKIGSHALVANGGVTAFYAGEKNVTPYITADSRTFVPLRFVAEKLGADVQWVGATKSVVITKGDTTITMSIGKKTYTVNDKQMTMDTAPTLMASKQGEARTMVPIRFVSEALGQTVEWEGGYQFVIIAPGGCAWDNSGSTEKAALEKANTMLLMYSSFV